MKRKSIYKIALCAVFTALIFVATYFIAIPIPALGYVNLGDAFVLLSSWVLGPIGAICAGVGSALADLMLGYLIYAPTTLIIKSSMSIACYFIFRAFKNFTNNPISFIVSALIAEVIMILGYFLFEGILYSFGTAILSIPFNSLQGALSIVVSNIIINILLANKTVNKYISSFK